MKKKHGNHSHGPCHHVGPLQLTILLPQTRPGASFRGDLTLPTLEERHELFRRTGELLRPSFLSVLNLRLQEAIIRGDERA